MEKFHQSLEKKLKVFGIENKTIELYPTCKFVTVVDQRALPHLFEKLTIDNWKDMSKAITDMVVRGAPLIGVSGAAAMALAMKESVEDGFIIKAASHIKQCRPTAVNLAWAVDRVVKALLKAPLEDREELAWTQAKLILKEDENMCRNIGEFFAEIMEQKFLQTGRPLRILTHCNAGWLATVNWGTALSGLYLAKRKGIPFEVFADETRPRLQGCLTVWELSHEEIPVTLITDNAGGLLMQRGGIDLVITGADRIASNGDVANKVGTYLKALAAFDNKVPFYVAAPISTFDWNIQSGEQICIEERDADEVRKISGINKKGKLTTVRITDSDTPVWNPGFDITPSRLVTGFVTERGVILPTQLCDYRQASIGAMSKEDV